MRDARSRGASGFLALHGRGTAPGAACGRLCRNRPDRDPAEVAGAILVAERATPDDIPRILASRGTITLGGALLSHVSLLSREFGKPSVSLDSGSRVRIVAEGEGVLELTDVVGAGAAPVLAEGDVVMLDGDRGIVSVPGGTDPALREEMRRVLEHLTEYASGSGRADDALSELLEHVGDGGPALEFVLEAGLGHRLVPFGSASRRLIAGLLASPSREAEVRAQLRDIERSTVARARARLEGERMAVAACEDVDELTRALQRLDDDLADQLRSLADLDGDTGEIGRLRAEIATEAEARRKSVRSTLENRLAEAMAMPDEALSHRLGGFFRLARRARAAGVPAGIVEALEERLRGRVDEMRDRVGDALVVPLHDGGAPERGRVGGKAAGLLEVLPALPEGVVVPRGFVVTSAAYRLHVLGETGERLRAALAESEDASVSRKARAAILSHPMPEELAEAVAAALAGLGAEPVAVRSSASIEDGATGSMAGHFDTALAVRGIDDVLHRVKQTWASLWNTRALRTMASAGISPVDVAQAVLIQQMVTTRSAGVLVTRDPGGRPDIVLINAAWGLGEGISQGEVPGDLFWVRRSTGEILSTEPGRGTKRIVADPSGPGTVELPLETPEIGRPSLTEDQVARLADLARTLEETTGRAQDVEFGFTDDDTLIVFQVRRVAAGRRKVDRLGE